MDDLKQYFSPISQEVLDLLDYHKRCHIDKAASGRSDPDMKEIIEHLDALKQGVFNNAKSRKNYADKQKEIESDLLESRKMAECPDCETVRSVAIIGEEKNESLNVMCDIVVCLECKCEFRNPNPNNFHDRLIYYDRIITTFTKAIKVDKNLKKNKKALSEITSLVEDCQKFVDVQLNVEHAEKELLESIHELEKIENSLYEYLLMSKINGMRWNDLQKFVN